MDDDNILMRDSICRDCQARIRRLIIPPDYYYEELGEEKPDDEEGDLIVHNTCGVLDIPLDHIVLECSRYKRVIDSKKQLIRNEFILKNLKQI